MKTVDKEELDRRIAEINARREELETVRKLRQAEADALCEKIASIAGLYPKPYSVSMLWMNLSKFGYESVDEAIEIAFTAYADPREAFNKIGGICYSRIMSTDKPDVL